MASAMAWGSRGGTSRPPWAVGSHHLGQRAGGVGDHRQPAGHGLAGREAEALEEGRHHRDARRRVLLDQLVDA